MLDLSKMKKLSRENSSRSRMYTCVSYNPKDRKLYIPDALLNNYLPGDNTVDIYIDEANKYIIITSGNDYKFCKKSPGATYSGGLLIVNLPLERGRYYIIGAYCAPGQICISYR